MKKIFTTTFQIVLLLIMFMPQQLSAQSDTLIVYIPIFGPPLDQIINNDVTNGLQNHKVYKLVSVDTTYFLTSTITSKSGISIIGVPDPVTGKLPCISNEILADGTVSSTLFSFNGKGTRVKLQNLNLQGEITDYYGSHATNTAVHISADSISLTIDNCVFDNISEFEIEYSSNWDNFYITNSVFRNGNHLPQYYSPEFLRSDNFLGNWNTDSIVVKNNTMICIATGPVVSTGITHYFDFSHNDVLLTTKYPVYSEQSINAKFDDNIFFNTYAMGESKIEYKDGWDERYPPRVPAIFNFAPLDSTQAAELLGHPRNGASDSLAAEAMRKVEVKNNIYYWSSGLTSFWTAWNDTATVDSFYTPVFMNNETSAMFNNQNVWPGFLESGNENIDPGFEANINKVLNPGSDNSYGIGLLHFITEARTGTGWNDDYSYQKTILNSENNYTPVWPLPESVDLRYSNTSVKGMSTDGLPEGDPNWFISNVEYRISFQVDMGVQWQLGNFNPDSDSIFVQGDFQTLAGDSVNWTGTMFNMNKSVKNDSIYSLVVLIPDSNKGKTINYKFVIRHIRQDITENIPARTYSITSDSNQVIPIDYFNKLYSTNGVWISQTSGTNDVLCGVSFTNADIGTAVGYGTILRTINGGKTWTNQISGSKDLFYGVCFTDTDTGNVVGFNGKILRTTDGGKNWVDQNSGTNQNLIRVLFTNNNIGTIVGFGGTILRTTNGGQTWNGQNSGTNNDLLGLFFFNADTGIVVGAAGTILKTTDGGNNWENLNSGSSNDLWGLYFNDFNTGTVVGINDEILRTTNGGLNWDGQLGGIPDSLYDVYFFDKNTGIAVGSYGAMIKTTDGGQTWISQNDSTKNDLWQMSFPNANTGYAVGGNGTILKATFGSSSLPVELVNVSSVIEGNNILLKWETATEENNRGFEIERRLKNNWVEICFVKGTGTSTKNTSYCYKDNLGQINYSGKVYYRIKQIDYNGTFQYSKNVEVSYTNLPSKFNLAQNFPNPFNPTTIIRYAVPKSVNVKLIIYNVIGQKVETLVNETKQAGNYEIKFDGKNLASGIYFYSLQSGNFISTKKMLILK